MLYAPCGALSTSRRCSPSPTPDAARCLLCTVATLRRVAGAHRQARGRAHDRAGAGRCGACSRGACCRQSSSRPTRGRSTSWMASPPAHRTTWPSPSTSRSSLPACPRSLRASARSRPPPLCVPPSHAYNHPLTAVSTGITSAMCACKAQPVGRMPPRTRRDHRGSSAGASAAWASGVAKDALRCP